MLVTAERDGYFTICLCLSVKPVLLTSSDLVAQKLFKCIQPLFASPQNRAILRSPCPALHARKDADIFFEDLIRQPARKASPQERG